MANNRKMTRGRRYEFRPATVRENTSFGPVHTPHPTRKIKWDIKYGPNPVKDKNTGRIVRSTYAQTHYGYSNR